MRVNEVRRTETIEKLVRIEYIAEDGSKFRSEEECKKYEESALFAVSQKLKRLTKDRQVSQEDINDNFPCDNMAEIFDIQTERDLENLRRYLYLTLKKNGAGDATIKDCFESEDGKRSNYVFENVTIGHEVIIFWSYDEDYFWVYGNGSIEAYCEYHKNNILKLITPKGDEINA